MSTPKVDYVRPEVTAHLARWGMIRDCITGEDALKASDLKTTGHVVGDRYLPKPNAADLSLENKVRYEQYIERAHYYNVVGHTHAGLVGQAFAVEPVLEVPSAIEALVGDVDGGGISLLQQAQKALGYVCAYGRGGLLTDYPTLDRPASQGEMSTGAIRPTVQLFDPWSIINWSTANVGAKRLLSLLVLSENFTETGDGFEPVIGQQLRVLSLVNGVYQVQIWRVDESGAWAALPAIVPTNKAGKPWTEIPFRFIGSENNDPSIDKAPLYDLASCNVAHYRNSADVEESSFIVGQPTPVISGLTQQWKDTNFKNGIPLGSRAGIALPEGGSATLLQSQPNLLPITLMERKERQMVALGARLVEQRTTARTATEARMEYATEVSVLGMCSHNVAAAYVDALAWAGAYAGTDEPSTFEIDPDAALRRLSPEELRELVAAWQAKALATSEMRSTLKRGGIATLDDEAYKDEVESSPDYGVPAAAAAAERTAEQLPDDGKEVQV